MNFLDELEDEDYKKEQELINKEGWTKIELYKVNKETNFSYNYGITCIDGVMLIDQNGRIVYKD